MARAAVAIGSNLGDRHAHVRAAIQRLRAEPGIRLLAASPIYETAPVDCPPDAGPFLNAVAVVETDLTPMQLFERLLAIERSFGRIRGLRNAPRTLDLDLVCYDGLVIDTPELTVPHPRMHLRPFVLVPLADVWPEWVHPQLHRSVRELLAELPAMAVRLWPEPPPRGSGRLQGRHCFVSGSSRGIGAAIAAAMEREGAVVLRHGRTLPQPDAQHFLAADLQEPAAAERLADEAWARLGRIDVFVAAAGADILTTPQAQASYPEKLDLLWQVDVRAGVLMCHRIGTRMKEQGRGCIITIGWDQAASGMAGDSGELFATVKGAVMAFSRSLARSLAPEVRVNCLAAGWIRTAWGETASQQWQEHVRRQTPLQRWGLPEDIAAAAVWLASDEAAFVTGQVIPINGGVV